MRTKKGEMKIGDKVRFLNTVGGGIVKGFDGKNVVLVEDEDGFDIPVLIRECVVIEPANDMQVRQTTKPMVDVVQTVEVKNQPKQVEYKVEETKDGEQISVCLAYLPMDAKRLNETTFECYLVNDSNYYLSYNYLARDDSGWISRSVGIIEPNTKLFVEEFDRTELNALERVCLQFIAYKLDKTFALKNPCSVELRIDTVKFYKLHSFRENDYFEDDALVYQVMRKDLPEKELYISPLELEQAMVEKDSPRQRKQPIERKEKETVLEVDLHINELLDDTNGLSSGDMLEYQLTKFREVIDENKKNRGKKIVFIHGKGDGTLKNAILKELKTKYKSVYYQDASFREYGYGATMVTIK